MSDNGIILFGIKDILLFGCLLKFWVPIALQIDLKIIWIVLNLITRLWTKSNKKPAISNGFLYFLEFYWIMPWRRHPDLNRGITVLQTAALATWLCRHKIKWSGRTDLNRRRLPWQGSTLPLSYARSLKAALTITNRFLLSIKIMNIHL